MPTPLMHQATASHRSVNFSPCGLSSFRRSRVRDREQGQRSSKLSLLSNKSIHYITHLIEVHPRIRFRVSRINQPAPKHKENLNNKGESCRRVLLPPPYLPLPHHYTKTGSDPFITKQGKEKTSSPVQGRTTKPVMMPNKSQRRSKPSPQPSFSSSSIRFARHASARLRP